MASLVELSSRIAVMTLQKTKTLKVIVKENDSKILAS